tara:strand:+ start:1268 stop:2191 length:924 start_codon:yes stop_codon:yes gene_type:complete
MKNNYIFFLLILTGLGCSDYDLKNLKDDLAGLPDIGDTSVPEFIEDAPDTSPPDETAEPIPDPSAPIAVCSVDPSPVSPPFESATWIGNSSYDPDGGEIVDYSWALVAAPGGSTVTMPLGAANRYPFTPVLAGTYVGELTVTNDAGLSSDPCEVTLEAVPTESLWVEMFWEQPQDDMDLHLLVDAGSLETRDDCYYSNCTPSAQIFFPMDWGTSGYTGDNPTLDLDDIPGTGPENINIDTPHPGAVYTVVVHDYTGSTSDVYGMNNVTVNVYLDGSLSWTDTRPIEGDGSYTYFARIDWTGGTITSL